MTSSKEIRHWHTKAVGVTKNNTDGKSRQILIRGCEIGEPLILDTEPDNPYDKNAIAIRRHNENRDQLGYLSSEMAAEIQRKAEKGWRFSACITDLTGGDGYSRGVNLAIFQYSDGTTEEDLKRYIAQNLHQIVDKPLPQAAPEGRASGHVPMWLIVIVLVFLGLLLITFLG